MENINELSEFIKSHAREDVRNLALKWHSRDLQFDLQDALMQIEARRKCATKLPWFLAHDRFLFPSLQSSEQATNQAVALYHSQIIGSGRKVADMTAGLGIDAMTFALNNCEVTAYEIDKTRALTLEHNAKMLGLDRLSVANEDSIAALSRTDQLYDWIYIDPARRDNSDVRCFRLQDSLPDVTVNEQMLLSHARRILIKGSPLLDITQTLRDLKHVETIHIVSFRGECKEVLIELGHDVSVSAIHVIDIEQSNDVFPTGVPSSAYELSCQAGDLGDSGMIYAGSGDLIPGNYLCETGAGVRKLNCGSLLASRFPDIKSFTKNSGLYISRVAPAGFPGKVSRIVSLPDSKGLKRMKGERLRVVSRAYPVGAADIRRKYAFREGDGRSLICTSTVDGRNIFILTEDV